MLVGEKVKQFLDEHHVLYVSIPLNSDDITKPEVPLNTTVSEIMRTVVVKLDDQYAMFVLRTLEDIDLSALRAFTGAQKVQIVSSQEFHRLFPHSDQVSLPVFGNLCGLKVYCSRGIFKCNEICFNNGTHDEILKLSVEDFIKLSNPIVGDFTKHAAKSEFVGYF